MTTQREPADFLPLPHLPFHILLALAEEGEAHGYALIKRIEEMTEGQTTPSSGSLYLAMTRMEDRGLLAKAEAPADETDSRRRYYRLSSLGRRVLEAESRRLAGLVALARTSNVLPASGE